MRIEPKKFTKIYYICICIYYYIYILLFNFLNIYIMKLNINWKEVVKAILLAIVSALSAVGTADAATALNVF